jgi:hypothetical protein
LEYLGLHNKPKAEVHPGQKLTGGGGGAGGGEGGRGGEKEKEEEEEEEKEDKEEKYEEEEKKEKEEEEVEKEEEKNAGTSDFPYTNCMAVNVWIQRPVSRFCYVHLYKIHRKTNFKNPTSEIWLNLYVRLNRGLIVKSR